MAVPLSSSVQPTPLMCTWKTSPTFTFCGATPTTLRSTKYGTWATTASPRTSFTRCQPPRSSGTWNDALSEPSAETVDVPSEVSLSDQPLGLVRFPRAVTHSTSTALAGGSPPAVTTAVDRMGLDCGDTEALAL